MCAFKSVCVCVLCNCVTVEYSGQVVAVRVPHPIPLLHPRTFKKSRKFSTWGLVPVVEKSPAWISMSPGGSIPGASSASCRLCVSVKVEGEEDDVGDGEERRGQSVGSVTSVSHSVAQSVESASQPASQPANQHPPTTTLSLTHPPKPPS